MRVRQVVLTLNQNQRNSDDYFVKLTEEILLFRTDGVCTRFNQCCSQQEKIVEKTQKTT